MTPFSCCEAFLCFDSSASSVVLDDSLAFRVEDDGNEKVTTDRISGRGRRRKMADTVAEDTATLTEEATDEPAEEDDEDEADDDMENLDDLLENMGACE